jgi:arylsulfatase
LIEGNTPGKAIATLEDAATLMTMCTERATSFIRKNKNHPFFLYLAFPMPHIPLVISAKFKGKSDAGIFGDVMEEIDWSVGEIMKTLEANGLAKNTLVIFTSDNGPWLTYVNHAGNTGGLQEGKGSAWDGGVKVPCIISWPGTIAAGNICNNMVASMDLLPTIMSVCKAKMAAKKIDGFNIWSLLSGVPNENPRDEFVYYYDRNNLKGIRKGNWKLVFPCISQTYKKGFCQWSGWMAGHVCNRFCKACLV